MLDLDNPPPDAPAMTTVASGAPKISIADAGISNSVDGGPRKARSRMEDRPLLTDDLIRGIITDGDHLPNLVRDGTAAGTVGFAFRRSKRDYVLRRSVTATTRSTQVRCGTGQPSR
jgi:hypothetical protein